MIFPETVFEIQGKCFRWVEGYRELSNDDLLFLRTECNIISSSLGREISTRRSNEINSQTSPIPAAEEGNATRNQEGELQKCFRTLQNTANEINNHGPGSTLHPRLGHQNRFIEARLNNLKNHFHSPKLIRRETWRHDAYDTVLWLIARHGSFAHALLVLYSIPLNKFQALDLGEAAGIVEYVIQHLGPLECAALHLKALELFGKVPNTSTM